MKGLNIKTLNMVNSAICDLYEFCNNKLGAEGQNTTFSLALYINEMLLREVYGQIRMAIEKANVNPDDPTFAAGSGVNVMITPSTVKICCVDLEYIPASLPPYLVGLFAGNLITDMLG